MTMRMRVGSSSTTGSALARPSAMLEASAGGLAEGLERAELVTVVVLQLGG
jgi:hypothetical protein